MRNARLRSDSARLENGRTDRRGSASRHRPDHPLQRLADSSDRQRELQSKTLLLRRGIPRAGGGKPIQLLGPEGESSSREHAGGGTEVAGPIVLPGGLPSPDRDTLEGLEKEARQRAAENWNRLEEYFLTWGYWPWERGKAAAASGYQWQPSDKQRAEDQREYFRARRQLRREAEAGENAIFGLDGKRLEDIEEALRVGYRRFDAAESYGNIELLAGALRKSRIPRGEVRIVYKILPGGPKKDIIERVSAVAHQFGGYLDLVLLHDLDRPPGAIEAAFEALAELKERGLILGTGASQVPSDSVEGLVGRGIDAIENRITPMNPDEGTLERTRQTPGLEYLGFGVLGGFVDDPNFVSWAREHAPGFSPSALLLAWARQRGALPITSSKDSERIRSGFVESGAPEVPASVVEAVERYWSGKRSPDVPGRESLGDIPQFYVKLADAMAEAARDDAARQRLRTTFRMYAPIANSLDTYLPDGPVRVPRNSTIDPSLWGQTLSSLILGFPTCNSCDVQKHITAILNTLRSLGKR